MPELFGLFRADDLRLEEDVTYQRMLAAYATFRPGTTTHMRGANVLAGTIAHHGNDPLLHSTSHTSLQGGAAWLGLRSRREQRCATHELLERLLREDFRCLLQLDPPYGACAWSDEPARLWLISDPFGLHPLYYIWVDGLLLFASKPGPLVQSHRFVPRIDRLALIDFFTYQHVTGNRTLVERVEMLGPGEVLRVDQKGPVRRAYTAEVGPEEPTERMTSTDAGAFIYREITASVKRAVSNARKPAITLSGGLDSRTLLGAALDLGIPLRAFTFGVPSCRDVQYASRLAKRAGVSHLVIPLDEGYLLRWLDHGVFVTGGMVNCIHYQILGLADALSSEADLVLDGLAGDALSGRHLSTAMARARSTHEACALLYRLRALPCSGRQQRRQLFRPEFLGRIEYDPRQALMRHFEDLESAPPWWGCHRFDLRERQRRFIQFGPHQLRSFLDVRTPFYAPNLVHCMNRLPLDVLLDQSAYRAMHRDYLPSLARVAESSVGVPPSWAGSVRLAKRALDHVRRRLPEPLHPLVAPSASQPTDYPSWFRGALRPLLEERLLDSRGALAEIVEPEAVRTLVRQHSSGRHDHAIELGCLLTLSAWLRSIDRSRSHSRRE